MPGREDLALLAHLMRRAGFGATRAELEALAAQGYEATVAGLLNPGDEPGIDEDELYRHFPHFESSLAPVAAQTEWVYRMVNTRWPLQEKMALFWHQLFATANSKVDNPPELLQQIAMFRREGLTTFGNLLLRLAQSPAMIYWLDNHGNHYGSINENWGRELLELFTMGVGHYSEEDVREAARAFTGWTIAPKPPRQPMGRFYWSFRFQPEDHDYGPKTFLGQQGNFNGGDIIDIIARREDTVRFLARHLYSFFVADEAPVTAWNVTPPQDPGAIDTLAGAYLESGGDLKHILRKLFHSDFFQQARFARVKSPAELVVGAARLSGNYRIPRPGFPILALECAWQGQELLNPPGVASWPTGPEWIDGGALVQRVNFAARLLSDTSLPGIRVIIQNLKAQGDLTPERFVDACLELVGPLEVSQGTRRELLEQARGDGNLRWEAVSDAERRVSVMLALIAATREYQFA